jgi:hypothetical protein
VRRRDLLLAGGREVPGLDPPTGPDVSAAGEILVERLRMALSEAGYPNAHVISANMMPDGVTPEVWVRNGDVPLDDWWRANKVVQIQFPCWSCWSPVSGNVSRSWRCRQGLCTAGVYDPREPPRRVGALAPPVAPGIFLGRIIPGR